MSERLSAPSSWSVYCNECDAAMSDAHFHCSICDGGDYDLCESCVEHGKLCPGDGHWLVKRFVKDGKVISSTTERLPPKPKAKVPACQEMPGAFTEDTRTLNEEFSQAIRTCNNCVNIKNETEFVTCTSCEDFDLCLACHASDKHGHNPAHPFEPATGSTQLSLLQESLLPAGRNVRHHAICDGCDKNIYGVRHKCFTCPDFDYCSKCVKQARHTHPQHRFAALYEPIPMSARSAVRHHGIYCDGSACSAKPHQTYIEGVRYKCVVCNDTDFCAACEAMPGNLHNKTHPLIKIKTPIRGLNVSTVSENPQGIVRGLGDKKSVTLIKKENIAPVTLVSENPQGIVRGLGDKKLVTLLKKENIAPVTFLPSANTTSTVQTVAEIKPIVSASSASVTAPAPADHQEAHFVRDVITDGMRIATNTRFTQVWTLRNPGPNSWPAGCSVRYIGGDNMLNLDNNRASSASDVAEATESNVIGREVKPGEEVAFKVMMKAPARLGKAISYWRLKSADGAPFGHRLWCDINVTAEAIAEDVKSAEDKKAASETKQLEAFLDQQRANPTPRPFSYYEQYKQRMDNVRKATEQMRINQMRSQQDALRVHREALEHIRQQTLENATRGATVGPPPPYYPGGFQAAPFRQSRVCMPSWKQQLEVLAQRTGSSSLPLPIAPTPPKQAESQVKAEKAVVKDESGDKNEADAGVKTSQMIFPTLDRESPASSSYQSMTSSRNSNGKAAYVEDEDTSTKTTDSTSEAAPSVTDTASTSEVKPEPVSAPVSDTASETTDAGNDGFEDVTDDLEVLSADGEDSEDDGFLTDEEYDILDASDQETVVSSN